MGGEVGAEKTHEPNIAREAAHEPVEILVHIAALDPRRVGAGIVSGVMGTRLWIARRSPDAGKGPKRLFSTSLLSGAGASGVAGSTWMISGLAPPPPPARRMRTPF